MVGFAGSFLLISAPLRHQVGAVLLKGGLLMDAHKPFSYVGAGAFVLVGVIFYMHRCSAPR